MGFLVTFEGIDGSGKTTVAKAVHEALAALGRDIVLTGEPTRTWLGDAVRRGIAEDTDPVTETFLFLADRQEHTERIRAWMAAGKTVLCDRYSDSLLAYQGARLAGTMEDPLGWLRTLSGKVAIVPDLILLLRIDPTLGLRRIADRDRLVRFEQAEFLAAVAANYEALARENPRYRVLDATRSVEALRDAAIEAIRTLPP